MTAMDLATESPLLEILDCADDRLVQCLTRVVCESGCIERLDGEQAQLFIDFAYEVRMTTPLSPGGALTLMYPGPANSGEPNVTQRFSTCLQQELRLHRNQRICSPPQYLSALRKNTKDALRISD